MKRETEMLEVSCNIYYEAYSDHTDPRSVALTEITACRFCVCNKSPTEWQLCILRLLTDCKCRYDL
jgi:hypothetical protein